MNSEIVQICFSEKLSSSKTLTICVEGLREFRTVFDTVIFSLVKGVGSVRGSEVRVIKGQRSKTKIEAHENGPITKAKPGPNLISMAGLDLAGPKLMGLDWDGPPV